MNTSATPRPWFAKGRYIGTENHMSFIGECRDVNGNWTDGAPAAANAAFIVRAVNSHDDLVEALKGSLVVMEMLSIPDEFGAEVRAALTARIEAARAALARAEAPEGR